MQGEHTKALLARVKELKLPAGQYAIFGSGPMGVRGLRECKDIDVLVAENIFDEYKNKSGWTTKKFNEHLDYLENNGIELWSEWGPGEWDEAALIAEAEMIEGLPFVKLETMVEWKKRGGRPKDLADVQTVEEYLSDKQPLPVTLWTNSYELADATPTGLGLLHTIIILL